MNRNSYAAVLAFAFITLSCGSQSMPQHQVPHLVPIAIQAAEIALESQGKAPILLRYHGVGSRSTLRISTQIESQFSLQMVSAVDAKLRGKTYRITAQILGTDVEANSPFTSKNVNRAGGMLKGLETVLDIDDRGVARALAIGLEGHDLSKIAAIAQAREQFAQLAIPLPQQAVGVGARWTATGETQLGERTLKQITRYHITAIAGSKITLAIEVSQTGDDMTSVGTGKATIDLAQPTAVELEVEQEFTFKKGQASQTLTGSTRIEVLDESIAEAYPHFRGSFPVGFTCPRGTTPHRGYQPEPLIDGMREFERPEDNRNSSDSEKTEVYDALWCESPSGTKSGPYWSLRDSGKIGTRGSLLRGKRTGTWTFNGTPYYRAEGHYKDGKANGIWTLATRASTAPDQVQRPDAGSPPMTAWTRHWKDGVLHGPETASYPRVGAKDDLFSAHWKNGKRDGVERDKSEGVIYGGTWQDGKKHGLWKEKGARLVLREENTVLVTYHQGELEGPYKKLDAHGTIIAEGGMRGGKRDGKWLHDGQTCTYNAGRPHKGHCETEPSFPLGIGVYVDGKRDGMYREFEDLRKAPTFAGTYREGMRNGEFVGRAANGSATWRGLFADDEPKGKFVYTFERKVPPDTERTFHYMPFARYGTRHEHEHKPEGCPPGSLATADNGEEVCKDVVTGDQLGPYVSTSRDGVLKGVKVANKFHGPAEQRRHDGSLVATGQFEHGAPTGSWTFFHPNGTKAAIGQFTRGKRSGTWAAYDTEGHRTHRCQCGDGALVLDREERPLDVFEHGAYLVRNSGHCETTTYNRKNGIKSIASPTKEVRYHENGTKAAEGAIRNRVHTGTWTTWRKDGSLETVLIHDGKLLHRTIYDEQGHRRSEGRFVEKRASGVHRSWDPRGRMLSQVAYRGGIPHGPSSLYDVTLRTTRTIDFTLGHAVSVKPTMCRGEETLEINVDHLPSDALELRCRAQNGGARGAEGEWTLAGYPKNLVSIDDDGTKQSTAVEGEMLVVENEGERITIEGGQIRQYESGSERGRSATFVRRNHYPRGAIATELTLHSGTGTYRAYYPNGDVREEGRFDSGSRTGIWRGYFPGATPRYTTQPSGLTHEYYRSGAIRAIVTRPWTRSRSARRVFERYEYYPNGRRKSMLGTARLATSLKEWVSDADSEDKHLVRWWDDGSLAYLGKRNTDLSWGKALVLFDAASAPTTIEIDSYDSKPVKVAHRHGSAVRAEGALLGGSRAGTWKFYDELGHLRLEGDYDAGKPKGDWLFHSTSGAFRIDDLGQECMDAQRLPQFVAYAPSFDPFSDVPQSCARDRFVDTRNIRERYERF